MQEKVQLYCSNIYTICTCFLHDFLLLKSTYSLLSTFNSFMLLLPIYKSKKYLACLFEMCIRMKKNLNKCDLNCKTSEQSCIHGYSVSYIFIFCVFKVLIIINNFLVTTLGNCRCNMLHFCTKS